MKTAEYVIKSFPCRGRRTRTENDGCLEISEMIEDIEDSEYVAGRRSRSNGSSTVSMQPRSSTEKRVDGTNESEPGAVLLHEAS